MTVADLIMPTTKEYFEEALVHNFGSILAGVFVILAIGIIIYIKKKKK